ncbi:E3 ubiquitin-protein ligase HUWE1-like [Agrilus planipennis]|uniref:E3 ubiquitin-protein ligase HUWE1 n=1 Tax=Agrilus planipennis TaxID=224129 RepID=A0A7F5RAL8_AGRPL|nr:E3 ubiquitin-protein ligase HUWE1-like [Agrilus planipennis]
MDELMRHQPSLKADATRGIIKLLHELCYLGTESKYVCWRPHSKQDPQSTSNTPRPSTTTEGSSDEEDDDEEEASTSSQNQSDSQVHGRSDNKTPIALVDYILNVMKLIDAILSNNSTDDHCREFVNQGGLDPLLKILGLPNLPVDCPVTASAQAVASVCKSILNLAHEPKVLKKGLEQLNEVLQNLKPLYTRSPDDPPGSKLLHELASATHLDSAFSNASVTPLLHAMGAAHGYVLMFVHVCRTSQSDTRALSLQHWGSEQGLIVLKGLAELYTSLVWESTLLLALCSEDVIHGKTFDCDFNREDMRKLNIPDPDRAECTCATTETPVDTTANVAYAMRGLSTNPPPLCMEIDGEAIAINKPTSQQLKYIKPLLGASSRLGRALAELFGLLVKLCVGSPVRQRRGQNIVSSPPCPGPYAKAVATALNYLLANGLNAEKLPPSPIPKFRLTFLICSVGFTSPMLFDEKRYPYHLMLQKFVQLEGLTTFFNTFKWALSAGGTIPFDEGIEHADLPEGTGEFLDAWLMLLEKMVNPKAILESPHVVSSKSNSAAFKMTAFDPLKYLIQMQKLAFDAVMLLWDKRPLPNYGLRMSESILTILRHILRAEKIINERLKDMDKKSEPAATSSTSREVDVNQDHLRQLMDMGFSREHATEALLHTLSLEQATDYLLAHPPNLVRPGTSTMDVDEDEQVMQAIALSLGDSVSGKKKEESVEDDMTPLSREKINEFTSNALQNTLLLIEQIPEVVYKVCDLLVTIMKRNGPDFRDEVLDKILTIIRGYVVDILEKIYNISFKDFVELIYDSQRAHRLGCFTHLYVLFFEVPSYFEMRIPSALAVHKSGMLRNMLALICLAEHAMSTAEKKVEPKWLTPFLLLLDSVGKVATCSQRKWNMHLVTNRVWKWYDLVTGKWTPYSTTNNKLINEAYWNGEQSIRVTCGRRRYTITFSNMLQCNDESGNNRPISMTPRNLLNDQTQEPIEMAIADDSLLNEKEQKRCRPVPNLLRKQNIELVKICVKLMHLQIDKDLLHAIMRVCLRLTRSFEIANIFVQEGGVRCLLNMRQTAAFSGYGPLATILIRHTLEDSQTLAHAIEKVIRGRTLPSIPPPYRELMYMVRQIGGAVTRSPETFFQVAKNILRVDCSIFRRNDEIDSRLPMRAEPSKHSHPPNMEEFSIRVIYDLLNVLVQPLELDAPDISEASASKKVNSKQRETMYQRASSLLSGNGSSEMLNIDSQDDSSSTPIMRVKLTRNGSETNIDKKLEQEMARKPLLAKHTILKILADAVVSYGAVAKLVTDYVFKAGCSEFITEDCTALAFMFDKLLPITENSSDRDCSMMCRMLIAAIASCNHSPEAQITLVGEVKSALIRALMMQESIEKHTQVQLLTGIIWTVIENCPPANNQMRVHKAQSMSSGQMNNMVKLMLKKGIFNDLARVPHCLDLSSPNFPATVNSALKPMEALSRIVNQPVTGNASSNKSNKKSSHNNLDDTGVTQSGTTSTEATNAQGEETIEDTENTDHDISAVASSLEANPEATNVPEESDHVLVNIMDQLLERGNGDGGSRSYSEVASSRNHHGMDIDEDANMSYDNERDATEELMSTDSGDSDSNASDQEVEDDDNENDVDDEDIDEGDENDENNYDDDDNNEGTDNFDDNSGIFHIASNTDRDDDDILMIQYAEHDTDNETLPRVRWNENGFAVPIFDEPSNSADQSVPIIHPLLVSRHNNENTTTTANRNQRTNRARRYQYLHFNPRNSNPPVILQRYALSLSRLLGPAAAQNLTLGSNQLMNSPGTHESARVVVMDNFSLFPTAEEQIDLVDQSGYLFGPSLAATLNYVPPFLHWWNEESKLLDVESTYDITILVCYKLICPLIKARNVEMAERKRKREEEETKSNKNKQKPEEGKHEEPQIKNAFDLNVTLPSVENVEIDSDNNSEHSSAQVSQANNEQSQSEPERTIISIPTLANVENTLQSNSVNQQAWQIDQPIPDLSQNLGNNENGSTWVHDSDCITVGGEQENQIGQPIPVVHLPSRFENVENESGWMRESNDAIPNRTLQQIADADRVLQALGNIEFTSYEPIEVPDFVSSSNSRDEIPQLPQNYFSRIPTPPPLDFGSGGATNAPDDSRLPVSNENEELEDAEDSEDNEEDRNAANAEPRFSTSMYPSIFSLITVDETNALQQSLDSLRSSLRERQEIFERRRQEQQNVTQQSEQQQEISDTVVLDSNSSESETSSSNVAETASAAAATSRTVTTENANPTSSNNDYTTATDDKNPVPQTQNQEESSGASQIQTEAASANTDVIMVEETARPADGNEEIPEGVDPSFLEALPPEMRREVLDQCRMLRLQQRASAPSSSSDQAAAGSSAEVSPEFLAALPPSLQEEVLTQQRLEQQRQAAARANPDEPVDAGAFFETLQPSLRTMILSDMEDSQMSALPPDLAAEAQTLRRDWEARNRQMMQERFFQSNLTTIIRQSARSRLGTRINTHMIPQRAQWGSWGRADFVQSNSAQNMRVRGRQLLDHEALSCLLVLIFTDDPKLHTLRLHRVIRNLCYHAPTREWIVKSLLSIIERSVQAKPDENLNKPLRRTPKPGPLISKLLTDARHLNNGASWLNIRMEAALGCHANVFLVNRIPGKRSDRSNAATVTIHPQAAPIVCKNALDLLISLSKSFPTFLVPIRVREKDDSKPTPSPSKIRPESTDFWDMLLKLDSASNKKGKSLAKVHTNLSLCLDVENTNVTFEQSAFGQLLTMLSSPIIYRSMQLTDKLLRLLSVITTGMPDLTKNTGSKPKKQVPKFDCITAPESALNLAVKVLTYKSCSEEGLEDVTNLLLNLSNCSLVMSYTIFNLLLNGAIRIGETVKEQIQNMLEELRNLNNAQKKRKTAEDPGPSTSKGVVSNRFTKENVVITASSKVKTSCDLQLPSMAPLTSKTSSQVFFLRVLRVIVQIRDAIKKAPKKDEEGATDAKKERGEADGKATSEEYDMFPENGSNTAIVPALSDQLKSLESLWETLSACLLELEHTPDHHAVLVLQPAVEAFFLVHSPQQGAGDKEASSKETNKSPDNDMSLSSSSSATSHFPEPDQNSSEGNAKTPVPPDQLKFLIFAEKHRTVLNQILRQTTAHLSDGPFSVLVDHTKVLDFDVKRRYFRTELERLDQGIRREETAVHVRRSNVFEDSFRELYRRSPEEWKNRFYIVFEDEEGQDAGGLLREWYMIISRDIFNPMYALFTISPGDRVTYMINSASHYNPNHLCYYKFVGRVIAKAIYDNKLLECYFTRSFYKHILGIPVKYTDMESEDYSFYRGLVYLMENNIEQLGYDLTFSTEINEFGVTETRDLIPNGRNVPVTEENKMEYIRLSCQMKMTGAIRQQLNAFLEGFYDIIPMRLISIFNEQELELLISGLPNVDIDDLKANTEYHKYQSNSLQIQWFWRALRSFDQAERAKFLQFVTGTSKVPLQGFAHLEGMNGVQKFQIHRDDRSTDRLPSAHTCFNQLDLPVYETYDKLRSYLLKAIHECSEGFGFA